LPALLPRGVLEGGGTGRHPWLSGGGGEGLPGASCRQDMRTQLASGRRDQGRNYHKYYHKTRGIGNEEAYQYRLSIMNDHLRKSLLDIFSNQRSQEY